MKENAFFAQLVLCLFLATAAGLYHRAKAKAPSPYASCAKMETEAERAQCRRLVDMAMSAGW